MRMTTADAACDPAPVPSTRPPWRPTRRYRVAQRLSRGILWATSDLDVQGRGHVPPAGPYILAINHISLMDAFVVFAVAPHQFAGLVARGWAEKRFVGWAMHRMTTIFPVDGTGNDPRSVARAVRWLKRDGVLLIAPEGMVSPTGALVRGNPGLAYLASRTGTPIVPLVAWGQERLIEDLRSLRRPRISVRIGEPLLLPPPTDRNNGDEAERHTTSIMKQMAALLPPAYRGVYG